MLLALPVDLEHQILIPLVVREGSGHALRHPHCLPVDMALLPDLVHIVRHQHIIALPIHLVDPNLQEVANEADGRTDADDPEIEVIGLESLELKLSLDPCEEQPLQWTAAVLVRLSADPLPEL